MASYTINPAGVAHAHELIAKRQYVLDSEWGEVQPGAAHELLQKLDATAARR